MTDFLDDDVQAAGDDYRDRQLERIIDRDLIITDPPASDWRPDPKDLC